MRTDATTAAALLAPCFWWHLDWWPEKGHACAKRRRTSAETDRKTAVAPNVGWATNFQYDSTTDGRPIKILSEVDEHTRECLGRAGGRRTRPHRHPLLARTAGVAA
jgi:hypothetical protein